MIKDAYISFPYTKPKIGRDYIDLDHHESKFIHSSSRSSSGQQMMIDSQVLSDLIE
jgi:hypothetical protein